MALAPLISLPLPLAPYERKKVHFPFYFFSFSICIYNIEWISLQFLFVVCLPLRFFCFLHKKSPLIYNTATHPLQPAPPTMLVLFFFFFPSTTWGSRSNCILSSKVVGEKEKKDPESQEELERERAREESATLWSTSLPWITKQNKNKKEKKSVRGTSKIREGARKNRREIFTLYR